MVNSVTDIVRPVNSKPVGNLFRRYLHCFSHVMLPGLLT